MNEDDLVATIRRLLPTAPPDVVTGIGDDAAVVRVGDRLMLLTDGMVERNAAVVDFPAAIAETRSLHPREAVRELADRVLHATGNKLSDDATILCLDWHGGHGQDRDSQHGAEQNRASRPLA